MRKPRRPRAQPTRQYPRTVRVNELVREIVADELERLDDERLELVAITAVEVEPDLRHAVVWFDSLLGEAKRRRGARGARRCPGRDPGRDRPAGAREAHAELTFRPDTGVRTGERIDEILRELPPTRRRRADDRRRPATTQPPMPDGFAVVDKQPGWTSHDVVARARKVLGERRVGHSGTLDPDATGVLLLGVGRATRLLRFLTALPKTYTAEIVFGGETSTLDVVGRGDRDARHDGVIDR